MDGFTAAKVCDSISCFLWEIWEIFPWAPHGLILTCDVVAKELPILHEQPIESGEHNK
jgi:hypothetical protein